jgi:ElaB/YqjD/DUF883 family membrane-anchored ribosome-binding protein
MATAFQPREKPETPPHESGQPREHNKDLNPANEPMDKIKDLGSQVADKAKEAASSVSEMASHAATNLGKKADELTETAGTNVRHLGDRIEEQGPHGGMLGQASHTVADTLRSSGRYMEEARLSGMADDMTNMIRRNPMTAVCIGVGIGFLLGRAMRA